MSVFKGNREHFPGISEIPFEGASSDNPSAFKFYDKKKKIAGKTMAEHLRFAAAYRHCFVGGGCDPFGGDTRTFSWKCHENEMDNAKEKLDAAFEFMTKLGLNYYCFHDRDLAPCGKTVAQSEKNLVALVELAKERQSSTGVKLLWGTANLFSHPRYMNGAATNPEFDILTQAAAQVKSAIDATIALGGENYVFWGGREGYVNLMLTDMKRELDNLAGFLIAARDYARKQGFKGTFLIEPKPKEPSTHQYDFDAATVIGFLRAHGLEHDFKLNIEADHATLAGHTFSHELATAANAGMLGSIDANRGDPQLGWDTDQFPIDIYQATEAMMIVLQMGGFTTGGLNFDAKLRRPSTDVEDLFIAHIGGMDTFARALEIAAKIIETSPIAAMKKMRYQSYEQGEGLRFAKGELNLEDLAALASKRESSPLISGKQELIENIINQYILRGI